jgi:hypothetical protein
MVLGQQSRGVGSLFLVSWRYGLVLNPVSTFASPRPSISSVVVHRYADVEKASAAEAGIGI